MALDKAKAQEFLDRLHALEEETGITIGLDPDEWDGADVVLQNADGDTLDLERVNGALRVYEPPKREPRTAPDGSLLPVQDIGQPNQAMKDDYAPRLQGQTDSPLPGLLGLKLDPLPSGIARDRNWNFDMLSESLKATYVPALQQELAQPFLAERFLSPEAPARQQAEQAKYEALPAWRKWWHRHGWRSHPRTLWRNLRLALIKLLAGGDIYLD